jgi:hypothetical protein
MKLQIFEAMQKGGDGLEIADVSWSQGCRPCHVADCRSVEQVERLIKQILGLF